MAMRLIDSAELIAKLPIVEKDRQISLIGAVADVVTMISECQPVDAVEIVRCRDCKNWMYECEDVGLCVADVPDIDGVQRYANDFCSYGERKTENP